MAKKDEQPVHLKHLQDHAPTVLHHPEDDQTILYRWLSQAMEKGVSFWLMVGGAVLAVFVVSMLIRGRVGGRSAEGEAWQALMLATGGETAVEQQVGIGELGVGQASAWAFLRAAEGRYREGFNDLPANREAALPRLKEAHDLFEKAERAAGTDPSLRRMAAMGMARTLEARGDLDGAVAQYERIAKDFPDTPEAKRAQELARQLRDPVVIAFYEQFSTFKPEEAVLPPGGTGLFDLPGLGGPGSSFDLPDLPGLGGGSTIPGTSPIPGLPGSSEPMVPAPPLIAPESTPADASGESTPEAAAPVEPPGPGPTESTTPTSEPSLPDNAFAPESPALSEPTPEAGELPANPFPDR